MSDNIITGFFTIGGIFIGSLLTWLINYFKDKRDRKDRYFFALLDKRFDIYQQAYLHVEYLKYALHKDQKIRLDAVKKMKIWHDNYNLYLEPKLRKDCKQIIYKFNIYPTLAQKYKDLEETKGWDHEDTQKEFEKFEAAFLEISEGLQSKIMDEIDIYFKFIN